MDHTKVTPIFSVFKKVASGYPENFTKVKLFECSRAGWIRVFLPIRICPFFALIFSIGTKKLIQISNLCYLAHILSFFFKQANEV